MAAVGKVNRGKQRCLNEVRPGRPEQSRSRTSTSASSRRLNEVRPGRPEQCLKIALKLFSNIVSTKSGLEDRNNPVQAEPEGTGDSDVSMKSGLEDRNNAEVSIPPELLGFVSMKSGLEDRNNYLPPRCFSLRGTSQ